MILLVAWSFLFWPMSRKELVAFFAINILFTINNYLAIQNGVFQFENPDLFDLPFYELGMWGFYLIHCHRQVKPVWPKYWNKRMVFGAMAFSLCFSLSPNQDILLISTVSVIAVSLFFACSRGAILLGLNMLIVGTLVEYAGVVLNMWHYPKPYPGGVAFWYVPMWFGVGFYYFYIMGPYYCDYCEKAERPPAEF